MVLSKNFFFLHIYLNFYIDETSLHKSFFVTFSKYDYTKFLSFEKGRNYHLQRCGGFTSGSCNNNNFATWQTRTSIIGSNFETPLVLLFPCCIAAGCSPVNTIVKGKFMVRLRFPDAVNASSWGNIVGSEGHNFAN